MQSTHFQSRGYTKSCFYCVFDLNTLSAIKEKKNGGMEGELVCVFLCVCVCRQWVMCSSVLSMLPSSITNDGGETWSITAHTHTHTHTQLVSLLCSVLKYAARQTHQNHINMHKHTHWPLQLSLFLNAWEWKHSCEMVPRGRERHGGTERERNRRL